MSTKQISALLSYAAIAVNIVCGFLLTPWLIKTLGTSEYAIYSLGLSLLTYFTIDFGFGAVITRFTVRYSAKHEDNKIYGLMGMSTRLYFALDILMVVVALVLYQYVDVFFTQLTPAEIAVFKKVYLICLAMAGLTFPTVPAGGLFIAYDKLHIDKLASLVYRIVYVVATVVIATMYENAVSVIVVYSILNIALKWWRVAYIYKKAKVKCDIFYHDKAMSKAVLSMSAWMLVIMMCDNLFFTIIPTLLGRYASSYAITVFAIASSVEGYILLISNAMQNIFLPSVTELSLGKDGSSRMTDLMIRVGRIQLMVISCLVIGVVGLGDEFIYYWVGDGFAESYWILIIILVPCLVHMTENIALEALYATNNLVPKAFCSLLGIAIAVVLTVLLSPYYGALGAGMAICASFLVTQEIVLNFIYRKILKLDIKRFFQEVHLRMLPALLGSLLVALVLNHLLPASNIWWFLAKLVVWGLVHIAILYFFCANSYERGLVRSLIRK